MDYEAENYIPSTLLIEWIRRNLRSLGNNGWPAESSTDSPFGVRAGELDESVHLRSEAA